MRSGKQFLFRVVVLAVMAELWQGWQGCGGCCRDRGDFADADCEEAHEGVLLSALLHCVATRRRLCGGMPICLI